MPKYTAYQGQDAWVVETLKGKKKGYFIDIGANDGISASNTFVLEKEYNWSGICVEPHSWCFECLCKNRSCVCVNTCIADTRKEVDFVQRGRRNTQKSGIYCDDADEGVTEAVELHNHPLVKKECISLLELLDSHNAPQAIDYLSLDTEGTVWLILKNFDFNKYRFSTITLEHNDHIVKERPIVPEHRKIKRAKIRNLLELNGYYLSKTVGAEDFYVDSKIK